AFNCCQAYTFMRTSFRWARAWPMVARCCSMLLTACMICSYSQALAARQEVQNTYCFNCVLNQGLYKPCGAYWVLRLVNNLSFNFLISSRQLLTELFFLHSMMVVPIPSA